MTVRDAVKREYENQKKTKEYWAINTNEFIFECTYNHGLAAKATTVERELRRLKAIDKQTATK